MNHTDYLFIMAPLGGWVIQASSELFVPLKCCVRSRKKWYLIELKQHHDWVRPSPKLQLLLGVPGLQKLVSNSDEPASGSQVVNAH